MGICVFGNVIKVMENVCIEIGEMFFVIMGFRFGRFLRGVNFRGVLLSKDVWLWGLLFEVDKWYLCLSVILDLLGISLDILFLDDIGLFMKGDLILIIMFSVVFERLIRRMVSFLVLFFVW